MMEETAHGRAAEVAESASEIRARVIASLVDRGIISPEEAVEIVGCEGTVTVTVIEEGS